MKVTIKVNDKGEHYFEIPDEYLKELKWKDGDKVVWTKNDDVMVVFFLLSRVKPKSCHHHTILSNFKLEELTSSV
ncbi:hypothetical protein F6X00_00215 [Vibrio vulnificus]|uniref:hypothetical protein n=1 Tax=Vibrio vulnificus TaxID=672 RepID=UPI0015FA9CC0|nr:hypothetical protein [Vibrio vulnificus]QMV35016.1 hypothetical protein F6X00_00215 [Vibrio vulnificus]HDY8083939.1 hypothetical protein [Vibrio vulnificus]